MPEPSPEHQRLLSDIDKQMSEAPDEATRRELAHLRERLSSPEMLEMARELAADRKERPRNPVLEFHDPLLPTLLTAAGGVTATAACLFAVVDGLKTQVAFFVGNPFNPWIAAVFAGAFAVGFAALSLVRSFSIRFDTAGMSSRVSGARWRSLRIGAMRWEDVRFLKERTADRVLEVHSRTGAVLDIPMRVVNFEILRQHLENIVRLYGDISNAP